MRRIFHLNLFQKDSFHFDKYHNNILEKITHVWFAENECIFHGHERKVVTWVQITNSARPVKISSDLTFQVNY